MASTQSGGEPKLVCIPKLNLLDVIRMNQMRNKLENFELHTTDRQKIFNYLGN